ncbi:MAG: nucleotidyl transferase AbiEii/AbiGii toxin family protein [Candidatus Marinimicrobia bacterium]|nr:nucleotidyl transferase AbiEii/AbiGii toxin family protein [Candidatus Neomarinimicrobiota bacterium]MBT4360970.1 nucleotidyl transferase AbiEii/AbiGii toxin family protein [Candidatus Neomarinimicrobiota bacterium]MBT4714847.1 nucleotidyl transferase AbiEii/AbiGii toxin family protein [Candidatus Neomarinimicrobiota bacterium]MBT4947293.1 nucleotidyl transferase AbiEii/AbiGii toxin family protein [Candidatus Neomarinimicrobiota bacterium]MBT5268200.1 nucleotidyl transferase AbiEii/AbiGii to
MIPEAYILEWQSQAPWQFDVQIEQDLILSRMLVEIFNDPLLKNSLLFRGGTAMTKLYFKDPLRYSEDLDFVQKDPGPIKPIVQTIQRLIDPWMGKSSTQARANGFRIYYHFLPESDPTTPKRIKIEINTREHFTVYGAVPANYSVDNRWYSGGAEISTYSIDELAGTKLRALYQRKKGRDLFDIDRLIGEQMIDHGETVKAFQLYLDHQNLRVTQKQFAANLTEKLTDTTFREDVDSLLVSGTDYDADKAYINTMQLVEIIP